MMMEGKFSGEGLAGIEEDTDMMSAMARELVEQGGVGETADDVWRQVNQQRQAQFGSAKPAPVLTADPMEMPAEEEPLLVAATDHLLHFFFSEPRGVVRLALGAAFLRAARLSFLRSALSAIFFVSATE